jgi:hypothetical protein
LFALPGWSSGEDRDAWLNTDLVVRFERAPNNAELTRVTLAVQGKDGDPETIYLRGTPEEVAGQLIRVSP